ncbi:copper chaperone for superoxide dismutase [Arctopsyche grandis]|uniref:copper chaperone for superoxide dismutase n=1 Tax=Arctopsyche grandis TaxID=121162 RepID=UPI00406D6CD6
MASSKMEFMVENILNKDDLKSKLLKEPAVSRVEIVGKESVVLESSLSCDAASELLKRETGGTAILWGFGDSNAAVAIMEGSGVRGVIRLGTSRDKGSLIDGTLDGLPPGEHSLQIHVAGDVSEGCKSLGPIYQPNGKLGQIKTESNGRSSFKFYIPDLQVDAIVGRSIAIATPEDEKRYACGVIARSAGLFQNNKKICACDGVTLWDEHYLPAAGLARQQFQNNSSQQTNKKMR